MRGAGAGGERLRRLEMRRRRVREELMVLAVLLLILAVTVGVLATKWLASGPSANPAGYSPAQHLYLDHGGTT